MAPIIKCQDLKKKHGQKTTIGRLIFTLPEGNVVGILGESDAGKPTFFRILTGLVSAESGTVSILGEAPVYKTNWVIAYLPDRARLFSDHKIKNAFGWGRKFSEEVFF